MVTIEAETSSSGAAAEQAKASSERRGDARDRIAIAGDDLASRDFALIETAFEERHPGLDLTFRVLQNERALGELRAGRYAAVLSSMPLPHRWRRIGHRDLPIAHVPTLACVHAKQPLHNLQSAQLGMLLGAEFSDWSEVGATQGSVEIASIVLERSAAELGRFFPGRSLRPKHQFANAKAIFAWLAKERRGLAFVQGKKIELGGLRALRVNGVEPSAANIRSRRYPLRWTLSLVLGEKPGIGALRLASLVTRDRKIQNSIGVPAN